MARRHEKREDGTTVLMEGTVILAIYHDGCGYCETEKEAGRTFFPPHRSSPRCRSGGRPHCTCDTCF
jgi:hypothetical protein